MKTNPYILYFCFFLYIVNGFGQALDSLKAELLLKDKSRNGINDTVFYALYLGLADAYRFSNLDSGLKYLQKAEKLATQKNAPVNIAECLMLKGLYHFNMGNHQSAKVDLESSVKILHSLFKKDSKNVKAINLTAKCLNNLGMIHSKEGDYDAALNAYDISQKLSFCVQNIKLAYSNKVSKAIVYSLKSLNNAALSEYFDCLKFYEKFKNQNMLANLYGNIGFTYFNIKEYDKALKYYEKGLILANQIKQVQYQTQLLQNIGSVYEAIGNNLKAKECYFKSNKLLVTLGDSGGIVSTNMNLAGTMTKDNQLENAYKLYKSSLQYLIKTNEKRDQMMCYTQMGRINYLMGDYKQSKINLNEARNISLLTNDLPISIELNNYLSDLYLALNNHKEAYKYYKQFLLYRDSLFSLENQKKVLEEELQYSFSKKQTADSLKVVQERKIILYKLKQDKQQRYILYIGLLLVLVFSIFIYNRYKLAKKQKEEILLQKETLELQKKLVDEKQLEIISSINYAKRIQQALLPNVGFLEKKLNQIKEI